MRGFLFANYLACGRLATSSDARGEQPRVDFIRQALSSERSSAANQGRLSGSHQVPNEVS